MHLPNFELTKTRIGYNGKLLLGEFDYNQTIRHDSVDVLHEVAKLLGITSYRILPKRDYDYSYHEPVFKTDDIIKHEIEVKKKKEEIKKIGYNLTKKINELPTIFHIISFDNVEYSIIRTEATYVDSLIARVDYRIYVRNKVNNKTVYFKLNNYVSKNGSILKKKINLERHQIVGNSDVDPVEVIKKIKEKYNEVRLICENILRGGE